MLGLLPAHSRETIRLPYLTKIMRSFLVMITMKQSMVIIFKSLAELSVMASISADMSTAPVMLWRVIQNGASLYPNGENILDSGLPLLSQKHLCTQVFSLI